MGFPTTSPNAMPIASGLVVACRAASADSCTPAFANAKRGMTANATKACSECSMRMRGGWAWSASVSSSSSAV